MCSVHYTNAMMGAILRDIYSKKVRFTAVYTHGRADGFGNLCKVGPLLLAIKALIAVFSLEEVAYDQKVVSLYRPGGFCTPDMNNGLHGMQKSSI